MASDDDDTSLGSLMRKKKQNGTSTVKPKVKKEELANGSENPKPKSNPRKPTAVKKEETDSDFDDEKPIAQTKPKKAAVKKEDKDDDKPLAKKSSNSKPDKVSDTLFLFFLRIWSF